MTPNLLDELEVVVRVLDRAGKLDYEEYADGKVVLTGPKSAIHALAASTRFLRTHHAEIADMAKRLEAAERDSKRLDFLQREVNTIGAYLLHNGSGSGKGFTGLGLKNTGRTLRRAIDQCLDAAAIDATREGEAG